MSQTNQVKDKCQIFRYILNIKTLFLSGSGYFTKYGLKCNDGKEIVLGKNIPHIKICTLQRNICTLRNCSSNCLY